MKGESLGRNTSMLYVLTLASYVFSFVTVPYQTRVLGPEYFGRVGVALAVTALFGVLLEFGFSISGTEQVTKSRDDPEKLGVVVSALTGASLVLIVLAALILGGLTLWVPTIHDDPVLYWGAFASTATGTLMPDHVYRGLEKMTPITVRAVLLQSLSVALVVAFVRAPEDYILVPYATAVPNLLALFVVYGHLRNRLGVRLRLVPVSKVAEAIRRSWSFFISRAAEQAGNSINLIALGGVYPSGAAELGFYSGVERLGSAATRFSSPLADSLYPYMVRTRNYRLLGKVIVWSTALIASGCVLVGFFAEEFLGFVLGAEFAGAGGLLRITLVFVAMTPLSWLLGFPALTPIGQSNRVNYSAVAGALLQIATVLGLAASGALTPARALWTTVATQALIIVYRGVVVWRGTGGFRMRGASS